jgi:hypothetical protein
LICEKNCEASGLRVAGVTIDGQSRFGGCSPIGGLSFEMLSSSNVASKVGRFCLIESLATLCVYLPLGHYSRVAHHQVDG